MELTGLSLSRFLTWLAGFPPFAAASTLVCALFAAYLTYRELRFSGASAGARLGTCMVAGAGLGLGLACIQLLLVRRLVEL